MSEWQPAIFIDVHAGKSPWARSLVQKLKGIILHIRPIVAVPSTLGEFREHGCDASPEEFYEVHPEDLAKLDIEDLEPFVLCRHEISTD